MDVVPVKLESPWEEEMAMAAFGPLSFYHAFFFPRQGRRIYREAVHFEGIAPKRVESWWRDYRYFLKKVQCAHPDRRLLLKNPANSARVAALREHFPGAKFIHIHRHPEEVYASTLFLHRKLQEVWALQDDDLIGLPGTVLKNYADLMAACLTQTAALSEQELIEVRMTDLESDPLATLESIYRQLELPGFDAASGHFRAYLEKIGAYRKNRLSLNDDERAAVRLALPQVFRRFGYG
jgi:omega-hydroxy-beta-dihydromenaquinone-9 sulfotransferase